jgi:hypothetical protein
MYYSYNSPYIIRMIKSKNMRWAGCVACMEKREISKTFWLECVKRIDHLEDLAIEGNN